MNVHIRWMIGRDMPEVLDIENHASESPWSEDDFSTALRQLNIIGTVAEYDYQVVGFVVYELHKSRLQLINVAVHQDLQRQGIGRQIVEHIKNKPAVARRSLVMLDVRETNLTAQRFFRAMGFKAVSILRDFYRDTTEDAYLMQCRVQKAKTTSDRFTLSKEA